MRIIILLLSLFLVSCDYHKQHPHDEYGTCIVPPEPLEDMTSRYKIILIDGCEFYVRELDHNDSGLSKVNCDCIPASKRNNEWDNPE